MEYSYPGWHWPRPGPGPGPDPAVDIRDLLDKAKIAQIKIREIDMVIDQLEKQIEVLKVTKDMLKQQYQKQ